MVEESGVQNLKKEEHRAQQKEKEAGKELKAEGLGLQMVMEAHILLRQNWKH
jgi:hypothetical protein